MKKKVILSVLFSLLGTVLVAEEGLEGKKVLMVIASSNFRDEEYSIPRQIFERSGLKVTVASSKLDEAVGMLKKEKVKPDILLTKANFEDYDCVVFVGGVGAKEYFADASALKLAKQSYESGKVVAAICLAPVILANAGILKEKKATVWKDAAEELKKGGANYTGADVEVDGRLVTANGPQAAESFARKVVDVLKTVKDLEGRVAVVLVCEGCSAEKLNSLKEIFQKAGVEMVIATAKSGSVKLSDGNEEKAKSFSEVKKYNILVVFDAPDELVQDKNVLSFVKSASSKKECAIVSIGTGIKILIAAKVLKPKSKVVAVNDETLKETLKKEKIELDEEKSVVRSENLVTAKEGFEYKEFVNAVKEALSGKK
ncbi:MAG: DJ-1/PfpI family protein [Planctomycetota bacterium]|nr:DJ-1/PfpI family protein [Planctomycetota bacterium]